MKSLRNEFGPEAKEFYNQSEILPMAKFKKAWDRKEYISYGSIKKLGPWANLDESVKENVSSPYIYQVGDLVQNVNPTCPHHGSKGIVMSVEPEELTYSVTNSGDTFKPGMRLTKTLDQLETM